MEDLEIKFHNVVLYANGRFVMLTKLERNKLINLVPEIDDSYFEDAPLNFGNESMYFYKQEFIGDVLGNVI